MCPPSHTACCGASARWPQSPISPARTGRPSSGSPRAWDSPPRWSVLRSPTRTAPCSGCAAAPCRARLCSRCPGIDCDPPRLRGCGGLRTIARLMRSHYCGQVDEKLIGQEITVAGWVHRRRDHGGVIFVDLRDREGLLQIVFDPDAAETFREAERLRNEFVIRVKGRVRERPGGTTNPHLASGRVELLAKELELLNRSDPLPFQLDEQVSEELRLKYRYLDLRREVMTQRLRLRHRLTRSM